MKKALLILGLVFCFWHLTKAAVIVVPGSSFPVTNSPQPWMRLLGVDTNGNASSDPSTRSNFGIRWDALQQNVATYTINVLGSSQNVLLLGCLGGTNDDTAILQNIIKSGGQFYFPPTNYTLGALNITNNTTWVGPGAVLNFKTNLTSTTMININSNVQNVLFDGLTFNGGNTNNAYTSNRGTNNLRIFARPCCNADVHFRDLRIYGFDIGVYPYGKPGAGSFTVQQQPRFDMQFCELATNGVGILCWSLDANAVVEYLTFNNLILHDNSYGFWINAGNINVANSIVSFNRVGFQLDGHSGINSGHGLIIGNTVNHSGLYPVICDTLATGYTIQNNKFLAGGTIQLWDSIKVVITGNHFDVDGNVFSGDGGGHGSKGPNYVVNNDFVGVWGINNGGLLVYDYTAGTDSTTNLQNWLNYSTSAFGADDPHHWNPFTTNSFVEFTTNPPPARAFVQGGSYLWNSNGVGMYIVLSSATGTNWTSTNAIPGAGGSSSVVLPPNALGLLFNNGSGTTNWYALTNLVVWTNQPSFAVGQYLQITGTNANGSLVVSAVTAPGASNYMAIINTPNLSNGMIAVFTGTTNSDGAPIWKGTNLPSASGSGFPLTSDVSFGGFSASLISSLYGTNQLVFTNSSPGASNLLLGATYIETNNAPFRTVASAGLHTVALNQRWTNDMGRRADLTIYVTFTNISATFTRLGYTNTTTGDAWTNVWFGTTTFTNSFPLNIIDISPGDFGSFSNYGGGISIDGATWKLK